MAGTYTATLGQAWDQIAKALWGDETLMHHLMTANPEYEDVIVFSGGEQLVVPDVSPRTNTTPAPWEVR